MPDDEPKPDHSDDGPAITGYGIGSAVLGVIAIAAIALAALIWTQHRHDADELRYRTRAMQAAADWTQRADQHEQGHRRQPAWRSCTKAPSVSSTPTSMPR